MQSRDVTTPIGLLSYASLYVYKALVTATVYAIIKLIEKTLLTLMPELTGNEHLSALGLGMRLFWCYLVLAAWYRCNLDCRLELCMSRLLSYKFLS